MTTSYDPTLVEQGSPEWLMARCGKITASRIADVVAVLKNGNPSADRERYKWQLVAERLTGDFTRTYTNDAMLWGIENEPIAREFYETLNDVAVDQVGFIPHPTLDFAGCSPDGLIETTGLIEIKCMTTINHLQAIYTNEPPKQYLPQVHWQMACTGSWWCDLTLFDPRVPLEMQMKTFRIERDEDERSRLEEAVILFNNEVEETIAKLWSNSK